METYIIKKVSNGEYKEAEKKFTLNVTKYVKDSSTLYFEVDGEEVPFVVATNDFYNIFLTQIENGLVESLKYEDGKFIAVIRDGNLIKNYTYDFNFNDFGNRTSGPSKLEELKDVMLKIVSAYNENPNLTVVNYQKYLRMILDIMDGDRKLIIEDQDELLKIFQVYHANKAAILKILLDNVVFYDEDGNVVSYTERLREIKLRSIKSDVLTQMELVMVMFAAFNNAQELYQQYNQSVYIPRRELQVTYVDENGNPIEMQEMQNGGIISMGREAIGNGIRGLKKLVSDGVTALDEKVLRRTRK